MVPETDFVRVMHGLTVICSIRIPLHLFASAPLLQFSVSYLRVVRYVKFVKRSVELTYWYDWSEFLLKRFEHANCYAFYSTLKTFAWYSDSLALNLRFVLPLIVSFHAQSNPSATNHNISLMTMVDLGMIHE